MTESPSIAEFKEVLASLKIHGRCKVCKRPFLQPGMTTFACPICSSPAYFQFYNAIIQRVCSGMGLPVSLLTEGLG